MRPLVAAVTDDHCTSGRQVALFEDPARAREERGFGDWMIEVRL